MAGYRISTSIASPSPLNFCSLCHHEKWGNPACPWDETCPKLAEATRKPQPMVEARQEAIPPSTAPTLVTDLPEESERSPEPSSKPQSRTPMIGEALRRIDELDDFLLEAMTGADRNEARSMLRDVLHALQPGDKGERAGM